MAERPFDHLVVAQRLGLGQQWPVAGGGIGLEGQRPDGSAMGRDRSPKASGDTGAKEMIYLWRISQTKNLGWDTYESAVVAARTEVDARHIHPDADRTAALIWNGSQWVESGTARAMGNDEWVPPTAVTAVLIGTAAERIEPGVVLASFRAG